MALVEHMLDMHACGVRSCGGKSSSIRSWQRNRGSAGHLVFLHAVIAVLNRSSSPIIVIEIGEIVEERVSKVRHAEWRSAITLAPKIKNKFIFYFLPTYPVLWSVLRGVPGESRQRHAHAHGEKNEHGEEQREKYWRLCFKKSLEDHWPLWQAKLATQISS